MGRGMERDTKGGQVMEAAGNYFGHAVAMGTDTVGDRQTPLVYVTWKITHIAENGDWRELLPPIERDTRWFLTDAAWPYTERKLGEVGFNGDFTNPAASGAAVDPGMELECKHEQRDGKNYERWDLPYGSRETAPPPDETLRRWGAKWKAERKPGGRPSTPPPAKPKPSTQITDEDIGPTVDSEAPQANDSDIPF